MSDQEEVGVTFQENLSVLTRRARVRISMLQRQRERNVIAASLRRRDFNPNDSATETEREIDSFQTDPLIDNRLGRWLLRHKQAGLLFRVWKHLRR